MAKTFNEKSEGKRLEDETKTLVPLWALSPPSLVKELFGFFCLFVSICFVFLFFLTLPVLCPFIRGNKIKLK